jgi:hypothetical protein
VCLSTPANSIRAQSRHHRYTQRSKGDSSHQTVETRLSSPLVLSCVSICTTTTSSISYVARFVYPTTRFLMASLADYSSNARAFCLCQSPTASFTLELVVSASLCINSVSNRMSLIVSRPASNKAKRTASPFMPFS